MRNSIIALFLLAACSGAPTPADPPAGSAPSAEKTTAPVPVDPGDVPGPDGEALYEQICVTCHGATGDGMGLEQQLFSFGAPEDQWKNGATIEGILTTLSDGIHDTSMQAFPQYGEPEREAIASYVLELRARLLVE